MIHAFKRAALAVALTATSLSVVTTAEARDRYHDRGNDAAIAIGAGIVGLAVGALIADRDDRNYYDRSYYPSRRYVTVRNRPGYYYYYDGYPNRYYRDRYYSRYYAPYYRERYARSYSDRRYYDRYNNGYRQYDRYYGQRNYDRNGYRYDRHDRYRDRDYRYRRYRD